ncbi:MAG: type II toxin-antitoxin system VapB family antitoxin [Spirochaetes bacterium]|nr:type II toxin-antitoxin system VapB family antitoxin [Spirochaetota bacterium]
MATNLAIDDKLIVQAQKIGGLKTKKDTVTLALKEFISRRKQEEIVDLFGSIDYDEDYNYKKLRKRK